MQLSGVPKYPLGHVQELEVGPVSMALRWQLMHPFDVESEQVKQLESHAMLYFNI